MHAFGQCRCFINIHISFPIYSLLMAQHFSDTGKNTIFNSRVQTLLHKIRYTGFVLSLCKTMHWAKCYEHVFFFFQQEVRCTQMQSTSNTHTWTVYKNKHPLHKVSNTLSTSMFFSIHYHLKQFPTKPLPLYLHLSHPQHWWRADCAALLLAVWLVWALLLSGGSSSSMTARPPPKRAVPDSSRWWFILLGWCLPELLEGV